MRVFLKIKQIKHLPFSHHNVDEDYPNEPPLCGAHLSSIFIEKENNDTKTIILKNIDSMHKANYNRFTRKSSLSLLSCLKSEIAKRSCANFIIREIN